MTLLFSWRRLVLLSPSSATRCVTVMATASASTAATANHLFPPIAVRGMTQWDPSAFRKTVPVAFVALPVNYVAAFTKLFRPLLFKLPNMHRALADAEAEGGQKPEIDDVATLLPKEEEEECDQSDQAKKLPLKRVYLNPDQIQKWADFSDDSRERLDQYFNIADADRPLPVARVPLTLANWKVADLLSAVLPVGQELSAFTRLGHLIHVNLRDHHEPYRHVIGQILLLHHNVRTVVNKTSAIDTTFRHFEMELLAGESDFLVDLKENGCRFQFDFSKVYWNSRLSTEHERVVNLLGPEDVLLDVMAGVGPFAVAAARLKKTRRVLANDLNPNSHEWLNKNVGLNKVGDKVKTFNMDGRDFIRSEVKRELIESASAPESARPKIHVVMNLPAIAVEFLDAFAGLLSAADSATVSRVTLPVVHVYAFSKEDDMKQDVRRRCCQFLGVSAIDGLEVHFVRNVAPKKDMFRATFVVPESVLRGSGAGIVEVGKESGADNLTLEITESDTASDKRKEEVGVDAELATSVNVDGENGSATAAASKKMRLE